MSAQRRKWYFRSAADEIAEKNLHSLRFLSILAVLMQIVFILISPLIIDGWKITPYHAAFVLAMLVFCFAVRLFSVSEKVSRKNTTRMCAAFWILLFGFASAIDVMSNPSAQSCLMPLLSIAMPASFILPISLSLGIIGVFDVISIIGTIIFKDPFVSQYDIFCALFSLGMSMLIYYFIMIMRIHDYEACVEYERLSTRDPLIPELYNKQSGQGLIDKYLETRPSDSSCALIVLDVDNFKTINDTYGHHAGDRALRRVGEVLQRAFLATDIISRFGGDEFIAFAKKIDDESIIMEKCNFICNMLKSVSEDGTDFPIKCSIGAVVVNGSRQSDFDKLFCEADMALYAAKNSGKGRYVLHHYNMNTDYDVPAAPLRPA